MARIRVDGQPLELPDGALLAAALGTPPVACRSLDGAPRGPLCGMGQCCECRVWVDGREQLACLTPVRDGMEVRRG
jgi:sarcosine oxidase subunit alpha